MLNPVWFAYFSELSNALFHFTNFRGLSLNFSMINCYVMFVGGRSEWGMDDRKWAYYYARLWDCLDENELKPVLFFFLLSHLIFFQIWRVVIHLSDGKPLAWLRALFFLKFVGEWGGLTYKQELRLLDFMSSLYIQNEAAGRLNSPLTFLNRVNVLNTTS